MDSIPGRRLLLLLKYRFKASYLRLATLSISTGWKDLIDVEMRYALSTVGGHSSHIIWIQCRWMTATIITMGWEKTHPASSAVRETHQGGWCHMMCSQEETSPSCCKVKASKDVLQKGFKAVTTQKKKKKVWYFQISYDRSAVCFIPITLFFLPFPAHSLLWALLMVEIQQVTMEHLLIRQSVSKAN